MCTKKTYTITASSKELTRLLHMASNWKSWKVKKNKTVSLIPESCMRISQKWWSIMSSWECQKKRVLKSCNNGSSIMPRLKSTRPSKNTRRRRRKRPLRRGSEKAHLSRSFNSHLLVSLTRRLVSPTLLLLRWLIRTSSKTWLPKRTWRIQGCHISYLHRRDLQAAKVSWA